MQRDLTKAGSFINAQCVAIIALTHVGAISIGARLITQMITLLTLINI